MKKFLFIVLGIIVVLGGLGFLSFLSLVSMPNSRTKSDVAFSIQAGEGVKTIASNLKEQGLISNVFLFETYVFLDGSQASFIAGDYLLNRNYSIKETVGVLTSGAVANEKIIRIIEGWTNQQIAEYLDKQGVSSKQSFLDAANVTDTRTIIPDKTYDFLGDKPAKQGLEGFLFPDTYRVFSDTTAAQIVEKMLDNFGAKFTEQMGRDARNANRSIYDIVILASIVEKEVRSDADRKIAAGIFWTRLKQRHPLQSDATVNYVTGKNVLQATGDDISVDSPYNTYKYLGLPPGPISNPSLSALNAAVYPEDTDYFYFLTKPDGSTVFSKTYEEHLENKRKYLQ